MNSIENIHGWTPAGRQHLLLIKAWEEKTLKQRIYKALGWVLQIAACYILIVLPVIQPGTVWKHALMVLLILIMFFSIWGMCIYEDEKELWGGKIYVRAVICIGRCEFKTRYQRSCYLDIADRKGNIWKDIEVSSIIMEAVENQDKMLAVTNDPGGSTPIRLIPVRLPVNHHF